jgi:ribose-phosphate pyrophosphokinase
MKDGFTILSGTANPPLASAVAAELGVQLGACAIDRYPDGEIAIQLLEPVRRREVYLVQPMAPPVNDNLVELLALADACRRAAATRITAIVPYFAYARANKRHNALEPITARMVADLLQTVGIVHVISMDLHTRQMEGFFYEATDILTAVPALCRALAGRLPSDSVVVSPDFGRAQLAASYGDCLRLPVVILQKRRESAERTYVSHIVGDVKNRACVIIDDMIATGESIAGSITALLEGGARPEFVVAATHGLFLQNAREKLDRAAVIRVFVTDTIPVKQRNWEKLCVVSIAPVIGDLLKRLIADPTQPEPNRKNNQPNDNKKPGSWKNAAFC